MRTLYHYFLCPFSRKIRLILAEKKLDFDLELERFWECLPEFLALNPAGSVPVLVDLNGTVVVDSTVIAEYLDEAYPECHLLGAGLAERAEVRRLQAWFDHKFSKEVTSVLVQEKIINRFKNQAGPDSTKIRMTKSFIHDHLQYISWLVDRRKWLAGDEFSVADLSAAAHLSVCDYLGDVPWDKHELVKDWYARLKSRPSFRALLNDRVPGVVPSPHYADLDF